MKRLLHLYLFLLLSFNGLAQRYHITDRAIINDWLRLGGKQIKGISEDSTFSLVNHDSLVTQRAIKSFVEKTIGDSLSSFSSSPWTKSGSFIYVNGGELIGINNDSPSYPLDIGGANSALKFNPLVSDPIGVLGVLYANADGNLYYHTGSEFVSLNPDNLGNHSQTTTLITNGQKIANSGSQYSGYIKFNANDDFRVSDWSGTYQHRFYYPAGGGAYFDIEHSTNVGEIRYKRAGQVYHKISSLSGGNSFVYQTQWSDGSPVARILFNRSNVTPYIDVGTGTPGNLSTAIRIDESQRVGIGGTAPTSRLHVYGDAFIDNSETEFFIIDTLLEADLDKLMAWDSTTKRVYYVEKDDIATPGGVFDANNQADTTAVSRIVFGSNLTYELNDYGFVLADINGIDSFYQAVFTSPNFTNSSAVNTILWYGSSFVNPDTYVIFGQNKDYLSFEFGADTYGLRYLNQASQAYGDVVEGTPVVMHMGAGADSYVFDYADGYLQLGSRSADPTFQEGTLMADSDDHRLYFYDGTTKQKLAFEEDIPIDTSSSSGELYYFSLTSTYSLSGVPERITGFTTGLFENFILTDSTLTANLSGTHIYKVEYSGNVLFESGTGDGATILLFLKKNDTTDTKSRQTISRLNEGSSNEHQPFYKSFFVELASGDVLDFWANASLNFKLSDVNINVTKL